MLVKGATGLRWQRPNTIHISIIKVTLLTMFKSLRLFHNRNSRPVMMFLLLVFHHKSQHSCHHETSHWCLANLGFQWFLFLNVTKLVHDGIQFFYILFLIFIQLFAAERTLMSSINCIPQPWPVAKYLFPDFFNKFKFNFKSTYFDKSLLCKLQSRFFLISLLNWQIWWQFKDAEII